jgi:hypothetical protein
MRVEELLQAPSLAEHFPFTFKNGFRVSTLGFWCLSCNTPLPLTSVHGHVSQMLNSVVDVTAAASCSCGHVNHYRLRLHDDATCSYPKDGSWVRERVGGSHQQVSLWGRFKILALCLSIRWKCYRLTRALKTVQRDFRTKHGLHH